MHRMSRSVWAVWLGLYGECTSPADMRIDKRITDSLVYSELGLTFRNPVVLAVVSTDSQNSE